MVDPMNSPVPVGAWSAPIPPVAEPKKRIAPISNVIHVREHMVRIFKEARRGECKVEDASRLIHMLSLIQRSFETSDLEERLRQLEQEK
jgi:hypothetical protein